MNLNNEIVKYIEENIFPKYNKEDISHGINHIKYVIKRSLKFAEQVPNINYDMVYVIAAYHDVGHPIDAKNHEKISAEMLKADDKLKEFFNEEEMKIMEEAVYDHRSSSDTEPRNIYGKIVTSADKNTSLDNLMKRMYGYRKINNPEYSNKEILEDSLEHAKRKFAKGGYATEKIYFEDEEYKKFLEEVDNIVQNKELFEERFCKINNIEIED